MSINKNTYGIIGYDLTKRRDKLLTEDVCESKWYENLNCYQRKGNIQIFDDPMSGEYLYFGYIFFETDEYYENKLGCYSLSDIEKIKDEVEQKLFEVFKIKKEPKIIVFNEFT